MVRERSDATLVQRFAELWETSDIPPDVFAFLREHTGVTPSEKAEILVVDQTRRRRLGMAPLAEEYLDRFPDVASEEELKLRLVIAEFLSRKEQGENPDRGAFIERFPDLERTLLDELESLPVEGTSGPEETPKLELGGDSRPASDPGHRALSGYDSADWGYAVGGFAPQGKQVEEGFGESLRGPERFRIHRKLGEGGFGTVYLAFDDQLKRSVALKVAHRALVSEPANAELYLSEARTLAQLDHPGIVPVYDAGRTGKGLCYIVEKYIESEDLATLLKGNRRLDCAYVSRLIATVAEALHYAHTRGVVHRDIKPANILLEQATGAPIVTDFGLALWRDDYGKRSRTFGTPAYMSPEQASGEGHLVDGRSDIFSLGVVLYELLGRVRPFSGNTRTELMERIRTLDARPLRQIDDTIPKELERICFKALSKRASGRYNTALDMAEDLRHFLARFEVETESLVEGVEGAEAALTEEPILPKGLRSFDAEDASFFIRLLPGPHGRDGLPESIRFWKTRIEETDPEKTFRVGLIYGMSGCGKTSLLRAGLLPRLDDAVKTILIEATPIQTEARLLKMVDRRCPGLESERGLTEVLAEVRRGRGLPGGDKLLIVIDQFEQWLHERRELRTAELVPAIRQCDGRRLQCLLLVRDDFWMAVTRFMREVEVRLIEGQNSAAVDLFSLRHARNVLMTFGRSLGALPEAAEMTVEQEVFLDRAVSDLSVEGMVVPVRLALFSEMVKGKPWHPHTLREVGGSHGVGTRFLEESFSSRSAPPERRRHERAVRAVLESFLPERGGAIRGSIRSRGELMQASGYEEQPEEFRELLRILDSDVRLLTPVDPEAVEAGTADAEKGEKHYHLTHDYLVPPIRDWLFMKQRETKRGRAGLLLAEQATFWSAKPERKRLPSLWEWFTIVLLTPWRTWTASQKAMMRRAGILHAARLVLVVGAIGLTLGGKTAWNVWRVDSAVTTADRLWSEGPQAWPKACEFLERAFRVDPSDAGLNSLLRRISEGGGLRVVTESRDAEIRITAQDSEGQKTGLDLDPSVMDAEGSYRPGERIVLAPGHYRLEVTSRFSSYGFPAFISQMRYDNTGEGWQRATRLLPHEVAPWEPKDADEFISGIHFAEEENLRLRLPVDVLPGMVYIPSGSSYVSEPSLPTEADPITAPPESLLGRGEFRGATRYEIVSRRLSEGFYIGQGEVTLGDFIDWFERFGDAAFQWTVDYHFRRLLEETSEIPIEVLRDTWGEKLEKRGPASSESREALCRRYVLTRGDCRAALKYRSKIKRTLDAQLRKADGDRRVPVADVSWELSRAYAFTHALPSPDELRVWFKKEIEESRCLDVRLSELIDGYRAASFDSLSAADIPADVRIEHSLKSLRRFEDWTLLEAYLHWTLYRLHFASQAPVEAVIRWAEGTEDAPSRFGELEKLKRRLQDPYLSLREPGKVMELVDAYFGHIERRLKEGTALDEVRLDAPHFVWFLEKLRRRESARQRVLSREFDELLDGGEEIRDNQLPWDLRLQFGRDAGWDLPTPFQWERACRGVDARRFSWGNAPEPLKYSAVGPGLAGPGTAGFSQTGADVSPFGVWAMTGGVSEWVRPYDQFEENFLDFAKGGNYHNHEVYADAGCWIAATRAHRGLQIGFRVVKQKVKRLGHCPEASPRERGR